MHRHLLWFLLVLSFVGLADSWYLRSHAQAGAPLLCTFSSPTDCTKVSESPYGNILGVPLATLGVYFYAMVFILTASELRYEVPRIRKSLQLLAALGVIASAYFMFIQVSVIGAVCEYCALSALTALSIFITAYFIEPKMLAPEPVRPRFVMPPPLS